MTNNQFESVPGASDDSSDDEDSYVDEQIDTEGLMTNRRWKLRAIRLIKFLSYPVVFLIVLCGSVISKGAILLMTSQLRKNGTILHCNRILHKDKTFVVTVSEEEKTAWLWCIIFAYWAPEVLTLIHSIMICLFQSPKLPKKEHFLLVLVMETFHVIGLAIMFMSILPDLNAIQGAMLTSCVCFVPGLLGLLSRDMSKRWILVLVDTIALSAQVTAFVIWPLMNNSNPYLWLIPVALILVSCGWWENYVSIQSSLSLMRSLGKVKEEIRSSKNFIYIIVSVWKMIVFCISSSLILHLKDDTGVWHLFEVFKSTFTHHNITITEIQSMIGGNTVPDLSDVLPNGVQAIMTTEFTTPIYVLIIQISSGYIACIFGKFACKTLIQGFSYALPVNITIPVLISLLIAVCDMRNGDPCYFHGFIPDYLFYESPDLSTLTHLIFKENAWIWLLWLMSQTWITLHICVPKSERPQSTEQLFITPYHNGLLLDQWMALNRRRDDQPSEDLKETNRGDDEAILREPTVSDIQKSDLVPKIYACATMWRESKGEMTECFKSILRLDKNQCAMKNYQECLNVPSPSYYELETHIFYDEAFKKSEHNKTEVEMDEKIKTFIKLLDVTALRETGIRMKPMKKYPTPYGGRLVWTLPGNTKMFVHLKDSSKIRHKKRWSQVMYMYYLLRHRIKDLPISKDRKNVISENSFILALDGDIVFQPSAVKLLLDSMKENKNLGAACGRIHPLGSGFMVWYQIFEYAVGHWLQKATEHVIGCVLCSPGCFTLFRANALMKPDVMKKYTTTSSEPRHYVQYDQGEDRWLCTLLLKRGYRVEYSAASDAYTHAPEGFYEFFKQRRRWLPSTMANIMDLLEDHERVVNKNKNISQLYMLYQLLLIVGAILGPGTIFLMLVGAGISVFKIGMWESFSWNIVPVMIFVVVCLIFDSKIQLLVAAVISMIYGLVMMGVIVGVLVQTFEDGWLAPSSMFLVLITAQFVITGIMHPQELECLPFGIIYFITVPSMYLILVIFSIANLNDVSWGTRSQESDQKTKEEEEEGEEEEKSSSETAKPKAKQNSFFGLERNDQGSIEFSFAGLFDCIMCPHGRTYDARHHLGAIEKSLERLEKRFGDTKRPKDPEKNDSAKKRSTLPEPSSAKESTRQDSDSESSECDKDRTHQDRAFLVNPYWLEDNDLKKGEVDFLSPWEEKFWQKTIGKYLLPIIENKEQKKKVFNDLKDLRDKCFITFFMLNALFVTIIFLMQLNMDLVYIKWPLASKIDIFYIDKVREVHIVKRYLHLEPIGLAFIVFFGIIMVIQFTAMLFHRLNTFTQILANTSLQEWGYCWKKPAKRSGADFLTEVSEEIVEELERSAHVGTSHGVSKADNTLDDVFRRRIFSMSEGSGLPRHVSDRKSTMIFQAMKRNESIAACKRLSQTQSNRTNSNQVNQTSLMEPVSPSENTLNPIRKMSTSRSGFVNHAFEIEEDPSSGA